MPPSKRKKVKEVAVPSFIKRKVRGTYVVLGQIAEERKRQTEKWGEQNHAIGSSLTYEHLANFFRIQCDQAFRLGKGTWLHILLEEVAEAMAEEVAGRVRHELIQVAAVVVAMVEKIDRGGLGKGKNRPNKNLR